MYSKIPRHIAIVLDGNRRYAKKLGLKPWKGHEFGIKKLEQLLEWCRELGIKELTLFSFSTENFKRSKKEKDFLFGIFKKEFNNMMYRDGIFKNKIRINVIGRLEMFPKDISNAMLDIIKKTKSHDKFIVNFAMAYGARQEITDAVRKIAQSVQEGMIKVEDINEDLLSNSLYIKSEPDIVIRPSGEKRISNFLLWQSSYSEFFFLDKLWPEFTKEDLIECIEEFKKRERRFGK